MALGYLDDSKLTNIANSIRSKTGSQASMTVDQMSVNIASIQSPVFEKDVNFYDWDGTLLYSYTLAEAQALQELPALPSGYKDYTADSWTETLSFINNLTYPWLVGVNYTTTRKATKVYITVPEPDPDLDEDLTVYVYIYGNNHTIDWGDGSAVESVSAGSNSHLYAAAGDYVVTIDRTSSGYVFLQSPSTGSSMFQSSRVHETIRKAGGMSFHVLSENLVTLVECGRGTQLGSYPFIGQASLQKIIMPSNCTFSGHEGIFTATAIKAITLPSTVSSVGFILAHCSCLELAIIPSSWFISSSYIYNNTYFGDLSLRKINWPTTLLGNTAQINNGTLYCCTSLETKIQIPSGATTTGNSFWTFDTSMGPLYGENILQNAELGPLPSTLTTIGDSAFTCWKGKTATLVIPASVTSIGFWAFRYSTIKVFIFEGSTPPTLGNSSALGYAGDSVIYVPYGTKSTYTGSSSYWSNYANYIYELPPA